MRFVIDPNYHSIYTVDDTSQTCSMGDMPAAITKYGRIFWAGVYEDEDGEMSVRFFSRKDYYIKWKKIQEACDKASK